MTERSKKKLKSFLIWVSVILSIILIFALLYGIFVESKINANIEERTGQRVRVNLVTLGEKPIEEKAPEIVRSPGAEKIQIAIILTNLGTNKDITEQALSMPKEVSLGFSPYTAALRGYFAAAVLEGRDVFLYMPFEPEDYPLSDPGEYAILRSVHAEKNLSIVRAILSEFPGARGIYGNYKEVFSTSEAAFLPIIEYISAKNMYIYLARSAKDENAKYLSQHKNIILGDAVIDAAPEQEAIKENLAHLLALARSKKHAIGYFNTHPISLELLKEWLENLDYNEIEVVPISKIRSE